MIGHWRLWLFLAAVLAIPVVPFFVGAFMPTPSGKSQNPIVLVSANSVWNFKAGTTDLIQDWNQLDFDDSHWRVGKAGFGYGDDGDRTELTDMRGDYAALLIRQHFEAVRPSQLKKLYLYMRFDDAFIAYLNGKEIARSHVIDTWDGRRIESHEASSFERFSIHDSVSVLRDGPNVLAIVGFNRSLDSSDFKLHPVLTTKKIKNPGLPVTLTPTEMQADVQHLQQRLEDQASYLYLRPEFNHEVELNRLRDSLDWETTPIHFAQRLAKLVAQIGDAHAEIKAWLDSPTDRFLPFRLAITASGITALNAGGKALLSEDYPIVRFIDGRPIEDWLEAASRYVPRGSPQLVRRESLRELRSVDRIRKELSLDPLSTITVTLVSVDGSKGINLVMDTLAERLPSSKVQLGNSRILDQNVGYLRIPGMYPDGVEPVVASMATFRTTDGLIIDVRGNRGGYYPILHALFGYFIGNDAPPYVANIAAYRLSARFKRDHLEDRPTFRANFIGWSAEEKAAISAAIEFFQPEWRLPAGQFSEWHYMTLSRTSDTRQYFYSKPIVVLSDAASYSATDIFLSAFSDLPSVTIIGGPSAGGSGATESFVLPNSGLEVTLSSMASFRPNGRLFDQHGVDVDVAISPTAGDFLGHSDSVLKRAVEWLEHMK